MRADPLFKGQVLWAKDRQRENGYGGFISECFDSWNENGWKTIGNENHWKSAVFSIAVNRYKASSPPQRLRNPHPFCVNGPCPGEPVPALFQSLSFFCDDNASFFQLSSNLFGEKGRRLPKVAGVLRRRSYYRYPAQYG